MTYNRKKSFVFMVDFFFAALLILVRLCSILLFLLRTNYYSVRFVVKLTFFEGNIREFLLISV